MSKAKIMIVEDEIIVAKNIKITLEKSGYEVISTVSSGEDAIEIIKEKHPDIILMDIELQGKMDGIEVADKIKSKYDIPVIYITAYSDDDTLRRARITEPFGYITKPFAVKELHGNIEMALYKHQMNKKLRESETRYRELFEKMSSGVAVYKADSDGNDFIIVDYNKSSEKIGRLKKKDVIGKSVLTIFPKIKEHGLFEVFQRVWKTGKPENHPVTFYEDKNISGWRENYVYKLPTGEIVAIYDDVTDRMKAEEEKYKAYAEIDQIFNTTSIGMWLIDKNANIQRVNDTFLLKFGMQRENIIGEKCYNIWAGTVCHTDKCPLGKIFIEKKPYEFETEKNDKDNNIIICVTTSVPFRSPEGEIVGMLESFTDITELRKLERESLNAIELERQRIGQDLHDSLGQKLSGIGFLAEALRQTLLKQSYGKIEEVDKIVQIVRDSIEHTRKISKGLNPIDLRSYGIVPALEELVSDIEGVFNISCKLNVNENIEINDNSIATNLYYIASESINNAIRHGRSTNIVLSLSKNDSEINLKIEDDGKGVMNRNEAKSDGIGLKIMRYRANIIGAEFIIKGNDKGTTISVKLKNPG